MCLGVPGRILDTYDDRGTLMGHVDFGGVVKEVCLAFTPDAGESSHVIVHAGVAITVVDDVAARESLELFAQMGGEGDGAAPGPAGR